MNKNSSITLFIIRCTGKPERVTLVTRVIVCLVTWRRGRTQVEPILNGKNIGRQDLMVFQLKSSEKLTNLNFLIQRAKPKLAVDQWELMLLARVETVGTDLAGINSWGAVTGTVCSGEKNTLGEVEADQVVGVEPRGVQASGVRGEGVQGVADMGQQRLGVVARVAMVEICHKTGGVQT